VGPGCATRDSAALRPAPLRQAPPPREGPAGFVAQPDGFAGNLIVAEVQIWLSPINLLRGECRR